MIDAFPAVLNSTNNVNPKSPDVPLLTMVAFAAVVLSAKRVSPLMVVMLALAAVRLSAKMVTPKKRSAGAIVDDGRSPGAGAVVESRHAI